MVRILLAYDPDVIDNSAATDMLEEDGHNVDTLDFYDWYDVFHCGSDGEIERKRAQTMYSIAEKLTHNKPYEILFIDGLIACVTRVGPALRTMRIDKVPMLIASPVFSYIDRRLDVSGCDFGTELAKSAYTLTTHLMQEEVISIDGLLYNHTRYEQDSGVIRIKRE